MATIRRLSDSDVRSIFESLHHKNAPPPHLEFQIVPVASNGLKLSPPSYEFEDGLYVLLKPQKKGQPFPDYSKVPPHLTNLIFDGFSKQECPWSLSGPQFPQPTAIQQRYCYPKGNPEYSSRKGGALWTMYGKDGKEDLEFRLLHVYYSAKRAVNKGVKSSGLQSQTSPRVPKRRTNSPSTNKRGAKRSRVDAPGTTITPRRPKATLSNNAPVLASSPAITASSGSSSKCASPSSFDTLPPATCQFSYSNSPTSQASIEARMGNLSTLSTTNYIGFSDTEFDDAFASQRFHPVGQGLQHAGSFALHSEEEQQVGGEGSTFPGPQGLNIGGGFHNNMISPPRVESESYKYHHHNHPGASISNISNNNNNGSLDPFCMNDPLMAILTKPSNEQGEVCLANHLEHFHNSVRDMIVKAPENDQAALVSSFSSWAKHVAKDPLERKMPGSKDV